jgi:hypothetical protein
MREQLNETSENASDDSDRVGLNFRSSQRASEGGRTRTRFSLRRAAHPYAGVAFAVVSVVILLLSGELDPATSYQRQQIQADSGLSGFANNTSFLPYAFPTSAFPTPSVFGNLTDNASFARVASTAVGNQTYWVVVYVNTDPTGNETLADRIGSYSPFAASVLAGKSLCPVNCSSGLPLSWTAPTTVASLGKAVVSGDALAAVNRTIGVALSTGLGTSVFVSPALGSWDSWLNITGGTPIPGTAPNITLQPCQGVLITTITATNLLATTFTLSCPNVAGEEVQAPSHLPPSAGPYVSSISPTSGTDGTVVTINGGNFASSAAVSFGGIAAVPVTYVSTSELKAPAPSGSGVVNVLVTVNGVTSNAVPADLFTYNGPSPPTVTAVSPNTGIPGVVVNITGTNFTTSSSVEFAAQYSTKVVYKSSTSLTAAVAPGVGTVDVTVTTSGGTSTKSSEDHFTYESPTLGLVAPQAGYATQTATLVGTNFAAGATVSFGPSLSAPISLVNSKVAQVTVPQGHGSVNVQFINPGGATSLNSTRSLFWWINSPYFGNRTTVDLPLAVGASAVWTSSALGFNSTIGIFAANASNDELVFYHNTRVGDQFATTDVTQFSTAMGSTVFTTLGATRLELPGGRSGLVAANSIGSNVFALFTTRANNKTDVESLASSNYGTTWCPPFLAASISGSVSSPAVSASPAGYFYAAWEDNGAGPWEVDQQEYSPSGRPVGNDSVIAGSQGSSGPGASMPSVGVDGLQRPLYAWTANAWTGQSEVFLTGGFPTPRTAASLIYSTLNSTTISDFPHKTTPLQYTTYKSRLGTNLTYVMANASSFQLCAAEKEALDYIYPYVGWALSDSYQNATTTCGRLPSGIQPRIAELSGPLTANMTLSVLTQWLIEALGFGVFPTPAWPSLTPTDSTSAGIPFTSSGASTRGPYMLAVQAAGANPTSVELNVTWNFPTYENNASHQAGQASCPIRITGQNQEVPITYLYQNVDAPLNFSTQIWTNTSSPQSYVSNASLLGIYLVNLSDPSFGTWHVEVTAAYQQIFSEYKESCLGGAQNGLLMTKHSVSVSAGWPTTPAIQTAGEYSTYFGYKPGTPPVVVSNDTQHRGYAEIAVNWTNSLYGNSTAFLLKTTNGTQHFGPKVGTPGYARNESFNYSSVKWNQTYVLYENSTSAHPGTSPDWGATYNLAVSGSPGNSTAAASCTFKPKPNQIQLSWWGKTNITGITASTAVLTWNASVLGVGNVRYKEAYGSWIIAAAQEFYLNGTYQYRANLRGLTPWGFYTAVIGVTAQATGSSCLYYSANDTWTFQTASKFTLYEYDLPYDSVSESGGGAIVDWEIPSAFVSHATYRGGYLTYFPLNAPSNVTLLNLSAPPISWCQSCYLVNLTALPIDQNVSVSIETNYSYSTTTVHGTSFPFTFWYERSTSGDGLTDWEKVRGWEVTATNTQGATVNRWVTANPTVWATNGLVGDLIEKRFGLNPQSLDSAGSHTLDTWNMTFSLPNSTCPLRFLCWYENGSNPFSFSPSPGLSHPPGNAPVATNSTTSPHTPVGGLQDDSPYDSEVLWTGGSLSVLQSLMAQEGVGWLRGVVMKYSGSYTLTVWGKLSWGANPLSASTLRDGIADGNQSSPVLRTVFQLNITSWWADLHSSNDEGAVFIEVTNMSLNSSGIHHTYYAGYGPNQTGSYVSSSTQYHLSIPIVAAAQFVYFNISVGDNASSNGRTWYHPFAGNPSSWGVDLLGQGGFSHHQFSQTNASISVTWHVARVGEAATTYLVSPANNTTLSGAPWGLKRYTAEPDFDLIVLNLSAAASVDSIAGAEGGWKYDANMSAGLNNILVPRAIFLSSPLGEALINNTNQTPMVPTGSGLTFHAADWSGRTETGTSNKVPTSTNPNPGYIWIYSTNSESQNGSGSGTFGGLPQNSVVESGDESLQVQAVYWINITSSGYGGLGTASAELADLLGGLASNSSGNVTNDVLNITTELGTLGLPENVMSALANVSLINNGSFNPPQYQHSSGGAANGWVSFGATIWNTVGGIAAETGVSKFASAVWNAVLAATVYLERAVQWLSAHLGLSLLLNQTVGALRSLASAMTWALDALVAWVRQQVEKLLSPLSTSLSSGLTPLISLISTSTSALWADGNSSIAATTAQAASFFGALFGSPFLVALTVATVVEIAYVVASVIEPGATFLADIVTNLVVGAAVTLLVTLAAGLIPLSFVWTSGVSAAWFIYNATGGGLHSMLLSADSVLGCDALLTGVFSAFGLITSYANVLGDQGQAALIFRSISRATTQNAGSVIYVPAVAIAFDIVGMILSVMGAFPPPGTDKYALEVDALLLSGISLVIGGIGLTYGGQTLWKYQLYGITLVGEVVGAIEGSMAVLAVAAGCS